MGRLESSARPPPAALAGLAWTLVCPPFPVVGVVWAWSAGRRIRATPMGWSRTGEYDIRLGVECGAVL